MSVSVAGCARRGRDQCAGNIAPGIAHLTIPRLSERRAGLHDAPAAIAISAQAFDLLAP